MQLGRSDDGVQPAPFGVQPKKEVLHELGHQPRLWWFMAAAGDEGRHTAVDTGVFTVARKTATESTRTVVSAGRISRSCLLTKCQPGLS